MERLSGFAKRGETVDLGIWLQMYDLVILLCIRIAVV